MSKMMLKFIHSLLLIVLFIPMIALANSQINASVNRHQFGLNETVTLTITNNTGTDRQIDLTPLKKNFRILGQGTVNQIIVKNGQSTSQQSWQIVLEAKHLGKQLIPAIKVGEHHTPTITVTVNQDQHDAQFSDNGSDVFATSSISPQTTYVGSQATFTLRLYYATRLQQPAIEPTHIDSLQFRQVGENTNYQKVIQGKTYNVFETHYAVIATEPKQYHIPGWIFSGSSLNMNKLANSPYSNAWQPFRVITSQLNYTVKAIPEAAKQYQWWLPSQKVVISENWSQHPPQFRVGEPITRTLTIQATGVSGEQLPALAQQSLPSFQVYPDKPEINTEDQSHTLIAKRVEKLALIPTQPGQYTLPEIKIPWWNIQKNQLAFAVIPAKTIQVAAAVKDSNNTTELVQPLAIQASDVAPKPSEPSIEKNTRTMHQQHFWLWSTFALIILWSVTLFAWWWYAKKKKSTHFEPKSQINDEKITSIRRTRKNIKQACIDNNMVDVKAGLIKLAKLIWPDEIFLSLEDVAEKFESPILKQHLQEIDEALYSQKTMSWQGQALWEELKQEFSKKSQKAKSENKLLPELYLHQK